MRTRIGFSLLVMVLLGTATANAQRLPPIPQSVSYSMVIPAASFLMDTTTAIPPTYWLEGGVIGGVAMGVLGVLFAEGMREDNDSHIARDVAVFMLGAGLGFTVGALIGGQFHKHSAPS